MAGGRGSAFSAVVVLGTTPKAPVETLAGATGKDPARVGATPPVPGPGRTSAAGPFDVYSPIYGPLVALGDDDPPPVALRTRLEAENEHQRLVDRSEFIGVQSARRPAEPFRI